MSDRDPLHGDASSQLHAELRQALGAHGSDVRVVGDLAAPAIRREERRRRRATAAGVAAVAVLALGVPAGWLAVSGTRGSAIPAGPTSSTTATASPTSPRASSGAPSSVASPTTSSTTPPPSGPAPTGTATGAPDAATLVPASGPVTGTTRAAYVLDGVFHAEGVRIALPRALARPDRATALGSGVLVSGLRAAGGPRVSFVDASGAVVWAHDAASTDVVTDAGHARALYVEPSGRPVVVDPSGRRTPVPNARTGSGTAPSAPPTPVALTGTAAYLVAGDATRTLRYDLAGGGVRSVAGAVSAVDRLTDRGIVSDPNRQPGQPGYGCQRLVDLPTGRVVWALCGPLSFTSFSADGEYLLGSGFSDGMPRSLVDGPDGRPRYRLFVVARATDGAVVLEGGGVGAGPYVPQHAAVMSADGTITTQADTKQGARTLQRCGLDGGCEVVGAAAPPWQPDIPESDGPYLLAVP